MLGFPLVPEQASTMAVRLDTLLYFLLAVAGFFATLICVLIVAFVIKYRRRSEDERPQPILGDLRLEIFWTVVPLGLTMIMFVWGARLFYITYHPPRNSLEINVVAKQWMWKVQHPEGRSEIDELHIPMSRPIKLILTSQDVIHDFFVPAFRVKMDVLPGRYTTLWFEATKPGEYHLFCAQYCGTQHSGMVGRIVVMEPARYQTWLSGETAVISMASAGEKLFQRLACNTCHLESGTGRGPSLVGLFGKKVQLQRGQTITADENYIRESILEPQAKIVAGYSPIMPTFKGLVSEDGIMQIVAYIKSLTHEGTQAKK
ncbi:MAG TPA: cytochrome c oxidase subunit II [Candidatus Acidoferrales bacterium]|nr:cytochrome c oxidase subunit II [Candidatus Acidoferrales bacterium]